MSIYDLIRLGQPLRHRTFIEPTEVSIVDDEHGARLLIAFRVYCTCGWASPVARRNQLDANADARAHRSEVHYDEQ